MSDTIKVLSLLLLISIFACSNSDTNDIEVIEDIEVSQEEEIETPVEDIEPDTTPKPTFTENQNPTPEDKKWVKVDGLSDEFNGEELDADKWNPTPEFIWNGQDRGWYGSGRSLFEADNVSTGDGYLRIEGEKFDSPKYSPKDNTNEPAERRYGEHRFMVKP